MREGNWEGFGAFKSFLIIDCNSQGVSCLFCSNPLRPSTEAGGSEEKTGGVEGGHLEEGSEFLVGVSHHAEPLAWASSHQALRHSLETRGS